MLKTKLKYHLFDLISRLDLVTLAYVMLCPSVGGGGIKTSPFLGGYGLIFYPNESNMVSNESWHLYLPLEPLNTFLSCIVLS